MTASTAPITLPAKHRQEAPLWPLHSALAAAGRFITAPAPRLVASAAAVGLGTLALAVVGLLIP